MKFPSYKIHIFSLPGVWALVVLMCLPVHALCAGPKDSKAKPRVIVTSDGEIDDECSMVRFLLYANEWDIEGIITSSSQYHWQGHRWAGDDWVQPYLEAYADVYPNLAAHDPGYPSPELLQSRTFLGNVTAEGEMMEMTKGAQRIVDVLLNDSDPRPIWIQAWGGPNTIARALKYIEDECPQRMSEVARKMRLYFIWEQDNTYQTYIRPHWGKFDVPTIISDQFIAIFYHWKKYIPDDQQAYLAGDWMKSNILEGHGKLCSLYKGHKAGDRGFNDGDFRSEGDSPAFLHVIPNGLRSTESPDWGGWGGRFVRVRDNIWLDPVKEEGYTYPEGRWYGDSAWGRTRLKKNIPQDAALIAYLKPQWRWIDAFQNDFAARADWCVWAYENANHPPDVHLAHEEDMAVRPGQKVDLSARGTTDPDNDDLTCRWWQYMEAGTCASVVDLADSSQWEVSFSVPSDIHPGQTIHIICEVTDNGSPSLTRYRRVVLKAVQ